MSEGEEPCGLDIEYYAMQSELARLTDENAKLRDMLARYIRQAYVQACDKGNPITVGIIENEARELGIEVPHD